MTKFTKITAAIVAAAAVLSFAGCSNNTSSASESSSAVSDASTSVSYTHLNGAHYRAHRQAVEVVVNEDEHAQQECGECCSLAAFDVSRRPFSVGAASASLVHKHDDNLSLIHI